MVKLWKVLRAVASVTSASSCEYFSEKWSLLTTLVGNRKEIKKSLSAISFLLSVEKAADAANTGQSCGKAPKHLTFTLIKQKKMIKLVYYCSFIWCFRAGKI